jgi:exonuclease-1
MGITNLLPKLQDIVKPTSIGQYKGERVAIDGSSWLYTSSRTCARDLGMGNFTDRWEQSARGITAVSLQGFSSTLIRTD